MIRLSMSPKGTESFALYDPDNCLKGFHRPLRHLMSANSHDKRLFFLPHEGPKTSPGTSLAQTVRMRR